jgi:GDPmannose 4,6-dehydratase
MKALITGITGQDGSYLAELLLSRGYEVHGTVRRVALEDPPRRLWRINHILDRLRLHPASLESYASLLRVVEAVSPDECYHLAAQSYVSYSFEDAVSTINTNINGTLYLLSAVKEKAPDCRVYFAGTSEMFGNPQSSPQSEQTPFNPRSPYGISKVAGFYLARSFRQGEGMFVCNGICFNHESERRGFEYVTRKISDGVARIKLGLVDSLQLGNLDATRDWGYSPDYVRAMHKMLQTDAPNDYVVATGVSHTVRQFAEVAFGRVGLDYMDYVVVDDGLIRPGEEHELRGDATKIRNELGWQPTVGFHDLVGVMVDADLQRWSGGKAADPRRSLVG